MRLPRATTQSMMVVVALAAIGCAALQRFAAGEPWSGALLFLWLVAIFGAVAGLVTAAIDLRMNAS